MKNSNKSIAKHIFLTGSIVAGSVLAMAPKTLNAETLFNYRTLGSGSDLLASLLDTSPKRNLEMKCGNKSESKEKSKTSSDSKAKDGKCGEGKCGDKKADSKVKDGKCGEGKCGDKKADSKVKDGKCGEGKCGDKKADSKVKDGKCGEGKCGADKKKEMKNTKAQEKKEAAKK